MSLMCNAHATGFSESSALRLSSLNAPPFMSSVALLVEQTR